MQYMLLIYLEEKEWERLSAEEKRTAMERGDAVTRDLQAKGQLVGASALGPVATATTVRSREGKTVFVDGPFAETREQLGGYYLIDVEDLDAALDVARRLHWLACTAIEVRPVTGCVE